ncbi:hypothetical protein [Roseomonas marmotae]|uniref:Uncharacterized protein n=1 Tax=Roseomonas marmotae TaxID=2768161 RepID=A0ABS3K8Z4_9PROT|nr:hypothetical protein [Roseomonas marmotae]MBO1073927.1 hypothetical protein [Roseomonas marmotae]QTI78458.1 hypothetical protein IAI58_12270 [Roseomonas marmotae]
MKRERRQAGPSGGPWSGPWRQGPWSGAVDGVWGRRDGTPPGEVPAPAPGWAAWLTHLRGALLVLLALPLAPTLLLNLIGGSQRLIAGTLLGLGGVALALRALRGGHGRKRAALMMGVGTGLLAGMSAQVPPLGAVIFGGMAWLGTALLYEGVPEPEPVAAPAPPPPPPAPDPLAMPRGRLLALEPAPERLRPATASLRELLDEMARQPDALPEARRFLNIQLDGLERIAIRLRAGAEPPEALDVLVAEMARGSETLRGRLRAAEREALEIQIKVLSERLREEGFA